MVTEFGKFLRKLRIDNDELMLDMAKKLKVSSAFLSSVENGKKRPSDSWNDLVINLYHMDDKQKSEWRRLFFYAQNMNEIYQTNVDKLKARYPDGFDVERANNRSSDDV